MVKLGDVFVNIDGDDKPLDAAFSRARGKTSAFGGVLQGILQGVGQRLFTAIVDGVGAFVAKANDAVQASSNLQESINKVSVVFGSSAKEILDWSATSDTALGQSQQQALEAAGSFGNLFDALGITNEATKDMSVGLVELAADLASFNNISTGEALEKLRAGIVGETEPLRVLGVNLTAATVEAKALALGIASSSDAISEQDKVLARYALIMEQTQNAQGDFARTSGELANSQRILAAQIENGSARLGASFRPAVTAITNLLVDLAPQMFAYAENIVNQFASGLASAIRYITPVLLTIRNLFAYWLKPGSPPRLLPDLMEWGTGALQAYLDGFKASEVKKALSGLGSAIESLLRGFVKTGQIGQIDLIKRVFGSREAIAAAVREFQSLGRVTSTTMSEIVRQAGPAGASVAGLVRAYFDLQTASANVAREQGKLNDITRKYQELIEPLSAELSENQAKQQALRDKQRTEDLRDQIADLGLQAEAAQAAQTELDALRAQGPTGNYLEDVRNRQRILDLEQEIEQGKNAAAQAELARLEIEEIGLRQNIGSIEDKQAAEEKAAQAKLDAAEAAEKAAQAELANAQAIIDLQEERNRLIAEEIALNKELEQARLDAIKKAADEAAKAQTEAAKVEDAKFNFEFSTADTAGQLALLQAKLASTQEGTVDYFNILTQLAALQKRYNDELANPALSEQEKAAQAAADAQFDYQFSIGSTTEKLALLNTKLASTTTGSAEYYRLLTQISSLDKQRIGEIEAITDAQFNYELAIASTPEKIELLKQKLAETTTGSVEYYQILGQISSLEEQYQNQLDSEARSNAAKAESERNKALAEAEQAMKQAQAAAEQLHQAQLQYNLAISDTPGKIALMQAELAKTTPGSAEYFNILTNIVGLQKQYTAELEKTSGGLGELGGIDLSGLDTGVTEPLLTGSAAGQDLAAAIDDMAAAFKSDSFKQIPADVKIVADALHAFIKAIENLGIATGLIEQETPASLEATGGYWAQFAGAVEGDLEGVAGAMDKSNEGTRTGLEKMASILRLGTAVINGEWALAWAEFRGIMENEFRLSGEGLLGWLSGGSTSFRTFFADVSRTWGEWLRDLSRQLGDWFSERSRALGDWLTRTADAIYNGGKNIPSRLLDGMKASWYKVENWFSKQLEWLRNQLPFSEPKDPSSPLRGLSASGSALVSMVQKGIESASLSINPLADSLLAPAMAGPVGATPTAGDIYNNYEVNVVINGNATVDDVKKGVNLGLAETMRSKGIKR